MTQRLLPGLMALLFLLPAACSGGSSYEEGSGEGNGAAEANEGQAADVECICGTTRGDLLGCPHPLCDAGKNNPDNDDCVCGTLTAGEDE